MAIKYSNKVGGNSLTTSYNIAVAAPFDVRSIVETYSDLTTKGTLTYSSLYVGMMVTVADTSEVYILKTIPSSRANATVYASTIEWVKVGGSSTGSGTVTVDSTDGLTDLTTATQGTIVNVKGTSDLYVMTGEDPTQEDAWTKVSGGTTETTTHVGSVIVDEYDDLYDDTKITEPYQGMLVVVKDDASTSEDEGGLYALLSDPDTTESSNWEWQKVTSGGEVVTNNTELNTVITTDGSTPTSNSGITINGNDESAALIESYTQETTTTETVTDPETGEETTVEKDTTFVAGTWYTSRGFHSVASSNDIDYEDDVDNIKIYGSTSLLHSYIQLFKSGSENWITICIPNETDDSLGFTRSDVTYIKDYLESDAEEVTMTTSTITLPAETPIKFAVSWGMKGMYEDRYVGSTKANTDTYTFGTNPGSTYDDTDIYTTTYAPTVYVYSNGTKIQVLTEADQTEAIPEEDIASLFDNI